MKNRGYLVKLSRQEFVSLPIADRLQPNFYKLPSMCGIEDYKTRLKKYHVQCCQMFLHLSLHTSQCLIFSRFLILFIYIINIGQLQVLFIIWEQLGKSYSATSTFKCRGSTAAVLVTFTVIKVAPVISQILVFSSEILIQYKGSGKYDGKRCQMDYETFQK